ncbi:MAG: HAMP domain-containing protein [Spirochaetaceae bacterium]|nr:MAG: HAMP domain-containing protein [Spirochaetaceae bacterium]
MTIRGKTVLVVLPLIVTPLLFAGLISVLLARNGITSVATQFLQFKSEQIVAYAAGQWRLLEENDLTDSPTFRDAAIDAISGFAISLIRSPTEMVFAVAADRSVGFTTGDSRLLADLDEPAEAGWRRFTLGGVDRVGYGIPFAPLSWNVFVTDEEEAFYAITGSIISRVGIVLAVSVVVSVVLLILFTGYLTRPLIEVVRVMSDIIDTSDLSRRVRVLYNDETGKLANTFNVMTGKLESAYEHIKSYAMRAATARLKEQKTRTIFQRYVPNDVIEQFFANPESMLVGENRVVSILFSDIRQFTTLSERMPPDLLVESLNHYFTLMVDAVMEHHGTVDKYIGDAIMALFGATVRREDDARNSVESALAMLDALADFNRWQTERDLPGFKIGIGINYGVVTVGNIGTEKKLDYTVIGDSVNVASRLEGLTKRYDVPIVISESVRRKIDGVYPTRFLDRARVKGRDLALGVYTVARSPGDKVLDAWRIHDEAMELYYARDFQAARARFQQVQSALPTDRPAELMIRLCDDLSKNPPGESWNGEITMVEK